MLVEHSPTMFCLPVGHGEAAWYDNVVGGGEPGPPITATTAGIGAACSIYLVGSDVYKIQKRLKKIYIC